VLPVKINTIRVHTIVDHTIIETIVNNRTAMITNNVNTMSETETDLALFGNDMVKAEMVTWDLRAANNLNNTLRVAQ